MLSKRLSIVIVFFLLLAGTNVALGIQPVKAQTTYVEVCFENGLNEVVKVACQNFVVTIHITDAPQIDFWEMEIHWDTTILELQTGTTNDVVEGPFMKSFGTTVFSVQDPDNAAGVLPSITCGFSSGDSAVGSGDLFYMNFHLKGGESRHGTITIYQPNTESYLMYGVDLIPFIAINGVVHYPIPPSSCPEARFALAASYVEGTPITLDGSASIGGFDIFPAPGCNCPITDWIWEIDEGNDGSIEYTLHGETTIYNPTHGFAGAVGIALTVLAPDPIPPTDTETYIDHNSEKHVTSIVPTPPKPVGGYSSLAEVYTSANPSVPYLALMAIMISGFAITKRKILGKRR